MLPLASEDALRLCEAPHKVSVRLPHITKTQIHVFVLKRGWCNRTKWNNVTAGSQGVLQGQRRNTPAALWESNGELYCQINQALFFATVTMSKLFSACWRCHVWHWELQCGGATSFNGSSQAVCQDTANRHIYGLSGTNTSDLWSREGCGSFHSFAPSPSKPSKAHMALWCNLPWAGKQYCYCKLLQYLREKLVQSPQVQTIKILCTLLVWLHWSNSTSPAAVGLISHLCCWTCALLSLTPMYNFVNIEQLVNWEKFL